MGNLFSEEKKDDGYLDLDLDLDCVKKWSLNDDNGDYVLRRDYVRHMEAPPPFSSDDTRDDGRSQHAYVQSNNVVHYNEDELANRAIKALDRAAESSPITGSEGRHMFLSLRGGREAVLALMEQWHPDLLGKMVLKKDGFPDARHHEFKMLMKLLGQYVPIFTKTSEEAARKAKSAGKANWRALKKLDKRCRTYKVLAAAGIDFDKMSLSESQRKIKMLQEFGNDTRLTATLRLAHSVKWYDSLVDDKKPGGHVNELLHLSGLKTLKERKQELQDACRRREEYERRRRQEEEDEHRRCQEEYERRRRQEEESERRRKERWERQLEEYAYWRQVEEDERRRQEDERRRQEDERRRQEEEEEEEYEQRYCGTVVSIKKNHANGTPFAFVHQQHGNIFLHPSDMRYREWVDVGDEVKYSIGYFNGRQKCVDVVIL